MSGGGSSSDVAAGAVSWILNLGGSLASRGEGSVGAGGGAGSSSGGGGSLGMGAKSGGSTGSSGFDAAALTELLNNQQYTLVMDTVGKALDVTRDPRAVNWCQDFGYRRGHVCLLYRLSRNLLKFQEGRVPSVEDLRFGMKLALLILVRTAQDVRCCHDDMAKSGLEFVFTNLRNKLWSWINVRDPGSLPPLIDVVADLNQWVSKVKVLPQPTWATSFHVSMLGSTFSWGDPANHDVLAFQRCHRIQETRSTVARNFIGFLQRQNTWDAVFRADLNEVSMAAPVALLTSGTDSSDSGGGAGAGSGAGAGAGSGTGTTASDLAASTMTLFQMPPRD